MLEKKLVNGYEIEFDYRVHEKSKSSCPLLFLHGLGGDLNMWEEQIEYFSKKYSTLAISLQGHGNSGASKDREGYSIANYAKTVFSIMEILKIKTAIIGANSMGGVIAYHMLLAKPETVAMLFTHGTVPKLSYSKCLANVVASVDKLMIGVLGMSRTMKILTKNVSPYKKVQEKLYEIMKKSNRKMIPYTRVEISRYDFTDAFFSLSVPIFIIRGEHDNGINREMDKLPSSIWSSKHVKIIDFKGGGHVLNMENPQRYNEILEEHINEYMESIKNMN